MSMVTTQQQSPQSIQNIPQSNSMTSLESTDAPGSESTHSSFAEPRMFDDVWGEPGIGIPLKMAKELIPLRADLMHWELGCRTLVDDEYGPFYAESDLKILTDPENAAWVNALNLCFLPLDVSAVMSDTKSRVPDELKSLLSDVRGVLSLFPDLEVRLGFAPETHKLLKLPEVARLLSVSESQVRKLAIAGEIESTKSQGETGHYRFTRSAVRKYVETHNVR